MSESKSTKDRMWEMFMVVFTAVVTTGVAYLMNRSGKEAKETVPTADPRPGDPFFHVDPGTMHTIFVVSLVLLILWFLSWLLKLMDVLDAFSFITDLGCGFFILIMVIVVAATVTYFSTI